MLQKIVAISFCYLVVAGCDNPSLFSSKGELHGSNSALSKDELKRKLFESYMRSPEAKMLIPTGRVYEFDRNKFCYIGQTDKYHIVRYAVDLTRVPKKIKQKNYSISFISQFLFYDKQYNYVGCTDYSYKVKAKYYDLDLNEKGEKILVLDCYLEMGADLQSCFIRGNQIVLTLTDNRENVHKKIYKTEPESYFLPTEMLIDKFLNPHGKKRKLQSNYDNLVTERKEEVIFLGKIKGYYLLKTYRSSYTQVVNPSPRGWSGYLLLDENYCLVGSWGHSDLGMPKFAMIKKGKIIACYNFTDQLYVKDVYEIFPKLLKLNNGEKLESK